MRNRLEWQIYVRNYGERMPFRGGHWLYGANGRAVRLGPQGLAVGHEQRHRVSPRFCFLIRGDKMARAYYGTKISPHKTRTPEGYLICHSVPLARTGWQEYLGHEIGLEHGDPVQVYRSEEEVFHPAAIASFEGKSVTDGHPSEWVQPANEGAYHRGHVQNVRRGSESDSDLLIGDLFVKDANLIAKIEADQVRETSCGYDCTYELLDGEAGKYAQKNIRGNHVAIVPSGRAGDRVAIRDSAPEESDSKNQKEREYQDELENYIRHGPEGIR